VVNEASTFGRSLVVVVAATIEGARRGPIGPARVEERRDLPLRLQTETAVVDRVELSWLRLTGRRGCYG
jgi:hypothetical protein